MCELGNRSLISSRLRDSPVILPPCILVWWKARIRSPLTNAILRFRQSSSVTHTDEPWISTHNRWRGSEKWCTVHGFFFCPVSVFLSLCPSFNIVQRGYHLTQIYIYISFQIVRSSVLSVNIFSFYAIPSVYGGAELQQARRKLMWTYSFRNLRHFSTYHSMKICTIILELKVPDCLFALCKG